MHPQYLWQTASAAAVSSAAASVAADAAAIAAAAASVAPSGAPELCLPWLFWPSWTTVRASVARRLAVALLREVDLLEVVLAAPQQAWPNGQQGPAVVVATVAVARLGAAVATPRVVLAVAVVQPVVEAPV